MKVYDAQGKPVWLGESVGRGGEANVYRVNGRSQWLAKIYEPAPRPNYLRKLAWMVAHPPENPTQSLNHPSHAWPVGLLFDARRQLAGYTMPHIQGAVPVLEVFNPRRRAAILPGFDRRYLHRAAHNLAATLGALHRFEYVAGDLNESNVLVTPAALVTLIDTDSFQVVEQRTGRTVVHRCPVGKFEYTPPELQGHSMEKINRLPEHDAFGLGVLIFQLLCGGNHPFRAQWLGGGEPPPLEVRIAQGGFPYQAAPPVPVRPPQNAPDINRLHPEIAELIRRCFSDGHRDPGMRPSPDLWERAISEAEKALLVCPRGHIYSNHLRFCPDCPSQARPSRARPASSPQSNPAQPRPAAAPRASTPQPRSTPPHPRTLMRNWAWARLSTAFGFPIPASQTAGGSSPGPGGATPAGARTWNPPHAGPARPAPWAQRPPALRTAGVANWLRLWLVRSLVSGGGWGALAGALPGLLWAVISWSSGSSVDWGMLWTVGGAAGGALRGWRPGYRISLWIGRTIGWHLFWQGLGLVGGALLGGLAGLLLGWWAIFPIFLGLFWGAKTGRSVGRRLWLTGSRVGWERLWAGSVSAGAGMAGALFATWAGHTGLGTLTDQLASALAGWLLGQSAGWLLVWAIVGTLGGAFGGAVAGMFTDLIARLFGLVD